MIRFNRFILIFLTSLQVLSVLAQSYSPQQIELAERLHSLAENAPPELAYIQTSKDIYETGEDLWFKVYLLDAQSLIPSLRSKTLYLQLLNETTKKPFWEEKYEIQNGFANGRIYLESTLPEGDYLLAAYTPNSFFNDTTEFKALRRIKVRKDIISGSEPVIMPVLLKATSIQFTTFPEGGDLISGIQSKLAFKGVNINGEPFDIEGNLYEDNIPILKFKSLHAGMGSFYFTPGIGKKYLIRLTEPATDSTYLLPEIYPSGMTIQLVGTDKESLSFKVTQSPELNPQDIYLRVQCRGIVYGMTSARLNGELKIKVPLSGLPQGITEVTLFNSNLVPVAERLVYVNHDHKLNISTALSKEIYSTRGKATLKISVKDENGDPVAANLGVSVFDKIYQNPRDSNNILAHYYLSTQLKGRIYNPSFYFNSCNKCRDDALDLLMLTQGWRKYVWNEVNLKKYREELQLAIFDGIRGEIFYVKERKKSIGEPIFVTAFSPMKDKIKLLIQADSTKKFIVPSDCLKAWEGDYIYLKPLGPSGIKPRIKLSDSFETINLLLRTKQITYPLPCLIGESKVIQAIPDLSSRVIRIKEVTIKGKKTNAIRGKYMGDLDSLAKLDLNFNPDDYVCLFGYLNCPSCGASSPGNTKPENGKLYKVIINGMTHVIRYGRPVITEEELLEMNNLSRVKAFFDNREFYKPNYDQETDEVIPDFRNTLLWEPSVITDENGEATLSFFCSDINTDFVGRIEGVGGEGLLGTDYFKFTVRKMEITP